MSKKVARKLTKADKRANRETTRFSGTGSKVRRGRRKPFVSKMDLEKLDPEFRRVYKKWIKMINKIDATMERIRSMENRRSKIS